MCNFRTHDFFYGSITYCLLANCKMELFGNRTKHTVQRFCLVDCELRFTILRYTKKQNHGHDCKGASHSDSMYLQQKSDWLTHLLPLARAVVFAHVMGCRYGLTEKRSLPPC